MISQIYETLITYARHDAQSQVPLLASGWSVSPDGRTYTFTLRPGIRFHNGAALTAEDVAFSFWRGMATGGPSTPQWLIADPLINYQDVTFLVDPTGSLWGDRAALQAQPPAVLLAACNTLKNTVTYDNATGTVVFHLAKAWGPFLDTIAQPWGSILERDWLAANGGWDGDCATWQNFYDTPAVSSTIASLTNGTGPYRLTSWTPGAQLVLQRHDGYWRHVELWPGAPTGPAALMNVSVQVIPSYTVRFDMLVNGQADMGYFFGLEGPLADHVLFRYQGAPGLESELENVTGTLRAYQGLLGGSAEDAFFVYTIVTGGPRNYVGSGALDGNGIPPDFFSDQHVREAFNYAFDWDAYLASAYATIPGRGAVRRTGPIIQGIMGYTATQPMYVYSPTLALQAFMQAWGGQVLANGFVMTVSYNSLLNVHQAFANTLKAGIEALSANFHVNIVGLPTSDYLTDYLNGRAPIFLGGWILDYAHPHTWVRPYFNGTFIGRQRIPFDDAIYLADRVNACVVLLDQAARACYESLQSVGYYSATAMYLGQPTSTQYVRAEVRGYYGNLARGNFPYFYDLSKGPLPVVQAIIPSISQTVSFTSATGVTASLVIPAGTLTGSVHLAITPDTRPRGVAPGGLMLGNLAFDVSLYGTGGTALPGQPLSSPITITIHYNGQALGTLLEDQLLLERWDGAAYVDAACGPYVRDLAADMLQVPICHLSDFALVGTANRVHLPLVGRSP
ncbi:MAG: hypothetical protein IT318_21725 [Anaerolineales bacterium]|nr:hypothetical protein [Anaerolineales bacterium]